MVRRNLGHRGGCMDVFEAIAGRRSIRKFTPDPVKEEDLRRILDAARLAPSGTNQQPWHFLVVRDADLLERLAKVVKDKAEVVLAHMSDEQRKRAEPILRRFVTFFAQAPVTIFPLIEPYGSLTYKRGEIVGQDYDPVAQSIGAAIQNLHLAAFALGYGTCWMTGPLIAREKMEELLGVELPWKLAAVIPLGRPAKVPDPRPRKSLDEIATFIGPDS